MDGSEYCICCLSKSDLQPLHEEIHEGRWPWEQPTVAGMILQCFNIMIEKDSASNTICSQCVSKVRDALSFREQVLCTIPLADSGKAMFTMQDGGSKPLTTRDILDTFEPPNLDNPLEDNYITADHPKRHLTFDQVENVQVQVCSQDIKLINSNRMVVFIPGLSKEATRAIYNNEEAGSLRAKKVKTLAHRFVDKRLSILEKLCAKYGSDSIVTYECMFCQILLKTMNALVEHVLCEHESFYTVKHLMQKGGIKYTTNKLLIPYELGENDVVCKICSEEFPHTFGLKQHMNDHYALYLCGQCGKNFATKERLKCHERRHNPKEATCGQCGLKFKNKESFYCHVMRKHKGDRKWHPCPKCSERFDTHNQRVCHLATVHGQTEKRYKCTVCPERFLTYSLFYRHKQKHARRLPCEHCGSTFREKRNLDAHLNKSHGIGEPVFVCNICDKSFASQKSCSRHARKHREMQQSPE